MKLKFALFAHKGFLPYIIKHLENDGHSVLFNALSQDVDICIVENRYFLYKWSRSLKFLKRNNIKLINFINDIPFMYFEHRLDLDLIIKNIQQFLYNYTNKHRLIYEYVNKYFKNKKSTDKVSFLNDTINNYINTSYRNRQFFQINYRKYLKQADLNLAVSKYTQYCVKYFLKLDVPVCYQCVNSDYLLTLPKVDINYDAVNISRIVKYKHQDLLVKAAKKLGLNIIVLGRHQDKSLKLDCPHYYPTSNKKVFEILNQTRFYVDASEFEGFGMTPVEAAFLDKISIASNTYIHREVLGDYPVYFEKGNIDDLVDKMKIVIEGGVKLNNAKIKTKYTSLALKERLMKHVESLF